MQQASEKLIKIKIYQSPSKINYAGLHTHNLEKLIAYSEALGLKIIIPQFVVDNSLIITSWEVGSRYDISFSINIVTIKKAYDVINNWFNEVSKILR